MRHHHWFLYRSWMLSSTSLFKRLSFETSKGKDFSNTVLPTFHVNHVLHSHLFSQWQPSLLISWAPCATEPLFRFSRHFLFLIVFFPAYVSACVCVCVWKRERDCVYVCVTEGERKLWSYKCVCTFFFTCSKPTCLSFGLSAWLACSVNCGSCWRADQSTLSLGMQSSNSSSTLSGDFVFQSYHHFKKFFLKRIWSIVFHLMRVKNKPFTPPGMTLFGGLGGVLNLSCRSHNITDVISNDTQS